MPTKCVRCEAVLEDGDEFEKCGQDYCENCYDHMFVSWGDVLKGKDDTNQCQKD